MMLDLKNVFSKTAPLYLRLMGGLSAGLIGGSFPLLMDSPSLWSQKMLVGYGMLIGGTVLLFVAMHLGPHRDKRKT